MKLIIEKAILHGLDPAAGTPIISETLMEPDFQVQEFLEAHFLKCLESDEAQKSTFTQASQFAANLAACGDFAGDAGTENFMAASTWLAQRFFEVAYANPGVPAGDLLCLVARDNGGRQYFGALKLGYSDGFSHYFVNGALAIIGQRVMLPSVGRKLSEAFIVDLATMEIRVIEKKFEMVDESRAFYISSQILECGEPEISEREKLMAVKKAVQKANKEILGNQKNVEQELLSRIHGCLTEDEAPSVGDLCEEVLRDYPQIEPVVKERLIAENIQMDATVQVSDATAKRFEKQSLKSSGGIEVKIPAEVYQDPTAIEFINNPDGTISVLIKNVLI